MVQRASDNPVAQEHYAAQVGLASAIAKALAQLRTPRLTNEAAALAQEFSLAAISLAADYYDDIRDYAGVGGSYRVPVISPWSADALEAYIDAALETFAQQLTAGIEIDAQVDALATQLALDAGSREIFAAIDNDPEPTRYARITRPGACSFCLMLAARGAVFRSEESSSFRAHTYPGLCRCDIEPVWNVNAYEPPAHIRAAQSLYAESTADSMSPAEKRNAFRRAVYAENNAR